MTPNDRRLPLLQQLPLHVADGRALPLLVLLAKVGRGGLPSPDEIEDDCFDWIDGW